MILDYFVPRGIILSGIVAISYITNPHTDEYELRQPCAYFEQGDIGIIVRRDLAYKIIEGEGKIMKQKWEELECGVVSTPNEKQIDLANKILQLELSTQ